MIHGMDTGFLVALENESHTQHFDARATVARLLAANDRIAIAPQVLAEFLHVATDVRRFSRALDMDVAREIARNWWGAEEVVQVFPSNDVVVQFLTWHAHHSLGRKRLLDTLLAATYFRANVRSILTTNEADFRIFGAFSCITPDARKNGVGPT
jgi:predicted nucleic acid-binding protein